MYVDLEDK